MNLSLGDRVDGFAALYEASYGAIHAYGSRRIGPEAADEIAAETFLVAWQKWDAIPADPVPWLYGVARNIVSRFRQRAFRDGRAREALRRERPAAIADPSSPEDPRLWDAWEVLRESDREVLALIAWEELSVTDAARVLGCSAAVFSVRLYRARRRFERLLASTPADRPTTALTEA